MAVLTNNHVRLTADKQLYPENVIFKCLYWYTGRYNVEIARSTDNINWVITLSGKKDTLTETEINELSSSVQNDLIDFRLREIVRQETCNVRELLIAKAFANFDTGELPPGEVSDPVGFYPA